MPSFILGMIRQLQGVKAKHLPPVRRIRLKDGQDAFALASPETKRQILAKFKELEGETKERRKAYKAEFWRFVSRFRPWVGAVGPVA
jgi:hypothetical protein